MRSYLDFKKRDLKRNLYRQDLEEGIDGLFDILKIDLMDSIRLPEHVCENDLVLNVLYKKAREEDYQATRAYVESLILHCKKTFYSQLLAEAEVAAQSPFISLKAELTTKIKDMVLALKQNLAQFLQANRSANAPAGSDSGLEVAPDDEPKTQPSGNGGLYSGGGSSGPSSSSKSMPSGSAPSGKGGASGPAPSNKSVPSSGSVPSGNGPSSNANAAAQPSPSFGGSFDVGMGVPSSSTGSGQVPEKDGFRPAGPGSLRPSDGYWSGLKRLFWRASRPLRRVWHNDPKREHTLALEYAINENVQDILDMIDKFQAELLRYVNDRIDQLTGGLSVSPTASASPTGATPKLGTGTPVGSTGPITAPVSPRGAVDPAAATGAPVGTPPVDAPAERKVPIDSLPPEEKPEVEMARSKAALQGAASLGLHIDGIGKRGGWAGVKPNNFLFSDGENKGQPIVGPRLKGDQQINAGWAKIRDAIYNQLYEKMLTMAPTLSEDLRNQKRRSGARGTVNASDKKKLVNVWLGVTPSGYKAVILDLLAGFYEKSKGSPASIDSAAAGDTPGQPATSAVDPAQGPIAADPAKAAQGVAAATAPPVTAGGPKGPTATGSVLPRGQGEDVAETIAKKLEETSPEAWNFLLAQAKGRANAISFFKQFLADGKNPDYIIDKIIDTYRKVTGDTQTTPGKPDVAPSAAPQASTPPVANKPVTTPTAAPAEKPLAPETPSAGVSPQAAPEITPETPADDGSLDGLKDEIKAYLRTKPELTALINDKDLTDDALGAGIDGLDISDNTTVEDIVKHLAKKKFQSPNKVDKITAPTPEAPATATPTAAPSMPEKPATPTAPAAASKVAPEVKPEAKPAFEGDLLDHPEYGKLAGEVHKVLNVLWDPKIAKSEKNFILDQMEAAATSGGAEAGIAKGRELLNWIKKNPGKTLAAKPKLKDDEDVDLKQVYDDGKNDDGSADPDDAGDHMADTRESKDYKSFGLLLNQFRKRLHG